MNWLRKTKKKMRNKVKNTELESMWYVKLWYQFSRVQLFATSWIAAHQASLSITNSQSLPKLMSIESVMPPRHLILCRPIFLLPPIPPSISVFPSESFLCVRWPKYWSFSFSISPSSEHPGLISFRMDWLREKKKKGWTGWISLQSKGLSRVFSNAIVKKHQFFGAQLSSQSNSNIHTWPLEKQWVDGPLLAKESLCFLMCYLGWS